MNLERDSEILKAFFEECNFDRVLHLEARDSENLTACFRRAKALQMLCRFEESLEELESDKIHAATDDDLGAVSCLAVAVESSLLLATESPSERTRGLLNVCYRRLIALRPKKYKAKILARSAIAWLNIFRHAETCRREYHRILNVWHDTHPARRATVHLGLAAASLKLGDLPEVHRQLFLATEEALSLPTNFDRLVIWSEIACGYRVLNDGPNESLWKARVKSVGFSKVTLDRIEEMMALIFKAYSNPPSSFAALRGKSPNSNR